MIKSHTAGIFISLNGLEPAALLPKNGAAGTTYTYEGRAMRRGDMHACHREMKIMYTGIRVSFWKSLTVSFLWHIWKAVIIACSASGGRSKWTLRSSFKLWHWPSFLEIMPDSILVSTKATLALHG